MKNNEHEEAWKRLKDRPERIIEKSECLTSDEIIQRLLEMGAIRKIPMRRKRMSLEEILFFLVAVGIAVMAGWAVYLWG